MKLKTVQPETTAAGIQIQGCGKRQAAAEAAISMRNWRAAMARCRSRTLVMELLQEIVRDRAVQPMAQVLRRFRPVVLAGRDGRPGGKAGSRWVGAHQKAAPSQRSPAAGLFSHTPAAGRALRPMTRAAARAPLSRRPRGRRSGGGGAAGARTARRGAGPVGGGRDRRLRGGKGRGLDGSRGGRARRVPDAGGPASRASGARARSARRRGRSAPGAGSRESRGRPPRPRASSEASARTTRSSVSSPAAPPRFSRFRARGRRSRRNGERSGLWPNGAHRFSRSIAFARPSPPSRAAGSEERRRPVS